MDLSIHSRNVVTPEGVEQAVVEVRDGRIVKIARNARATEGVIDVGDLWLLPGLVDTHVHVNEPGRTEWEGFDTASRAAAAGGVTTLVDMPLNSIPATTTAAALHAKAECARARCRVDHAFWGGVIPGNVAELEPLAEAGAPGFKCFLVPSGVDEFPNVTELDLRAAMPLIARLGLPLLAHAELPGPIDRAAVEVASLDPHRYATWLAARPPEAEHLAIAVLIALARTTGCRVHIVHLSSSAAISMLRSARAEGLPITVETCPHYLFFAADDVPDGATPFKCAPPIRARANRERLWEALRDGDIDMIATDHSPCPPAMKEPHAGFMAAWGGIASLELGLGAVWTEARRRGFGPADIARWMSGAPARLAGLEARKGRIAVGADGDLVVWNPEGHTAVETRRLHQRHPVTPYVGLTLGGRVERTYLRGTCVFDGTGFPGTTHGAHLGAPRMDASRGRP